MRYNFNVILNGELIADPEGTELSTAESAHAEAAIVCSELLWHFSGSVMARAVLEVIAESGERVIALPIGSPSENLCCA